MKRSSVVLIGGLLLAGLTGAVWADAGFWAGPKGVAFHPQNSGLHRYYRPYWGGGLEFGWRAWKHIELGAEGSYIRALGKEEMEETDASGNVVGTFNDENSFLILSSKVSYRFLGQRTPYLGFGVGFYRASWKLVGLSREYPEIHPISHSSVGTQLFAGYDFRVRRWFGLRGEGGVQIARAEDEYEQYQWPYGDMGGWKASLGAYVAW